MAISRSVHDSSSNNSADGARACLPCCEPGEGAATLSRSEIPNQPGSGSRRFGAGGPKLAPLLALVRPARARWPDQVAGPGHDRWPLARTQDKALAALVAESAGDAQRSAADFPLPVGRGEGQGEGNPPGP